MERKARPEGFAHKQNHNQNKKGKSNMFTGQQIKALPEFISKQEFIEAFNLIDDFYLIIISFFIVFTFVITLLISDDLNNILENKINPYLRKKLTQAKIKKKQTG